jgi:hypothetical protein
MKRHHLGGVAELNRALLPMDVEAHEGAAVLPLYKQF